MPERVDAPQGSLRHRIHVPTLFAAGIFGLIASPALVFTARLVSPSGFSAVYLAGSAALLVAGGGLCLWASWMNREARALPAFSLYLFLASVVVCLGAFALALLPDPTVFLATLTGALAAIVVTKMEALLTRTKPADEPRPPEVTSDPMRSEEAPKTEQPPPQP